MGNCKLPCAWVGVLMTPPNYGKIRQAGGVKVGRGAGGGAAGCGESHDGGERSGERVRRKGVLGEEAVQA